MEFTVRPPNPLSHMGTTKENWEDWKQDFLLYLEVNFKNAPNPVKVSLLKIHLGMEQVLHNIIEDKRKMMGPKVLEDKNILNILLSELDKYFSDKCNSVPKNEVIARYQFFKAEIKTNLRTYIKQLRKKAAACNFGDNENSLIRDKVILEISDDRLREKLFNEENLDLSRLIIICTEHTADNMRRNNDTAKITDNTDNALTANDRSNVKRTQNNNINKNQIIPSRNDNDDTNDAINAIKLKRSIKSDKSNVKDLQENNTCKNQTVPSKNNNDSDNTASIKSDKNDVKRTTKENMSKNKTIPSKNDNNDTGNASASGPKQSNQAARSSCSNNNPPNNVQFKRNCWRCNQKHPIRCCPAWGSRCEKCGELHHYTSHCPKFHQRKLNEGFISHSNETHSQQGHPTAPPANVIESVLYPKLPPYNPNLIHTVHPELRTQHISNQPGTSNMYNTNPPWLWMPGQNAQVYETLQRDPASPNNIPPNLMNIPPNNCSDSQGAQEATTKSKKEKSKNECVLQ